MKTKKLIAIITITLLTLLIIIPTTNTTNTTTITAQNTITPITLQLLFDQANNQPKQITTEPLGKYVQNGSIITYDSLLTYASMFPGGIPQYQGYQFPFIFYYNYSAWGDWFIVSIGSKYFAIHNQTREVGLNSTGGLFPTPPASESEIVRRNNVYAFIALPTGIKAGNNIQIMAPYFIEEIVPEVVASEVTGRVTTPTFSQTEGSSSFYDTWITQGTWKGTITLGDITIRCAMGLNTFAEKTSGLGVSSTIAESLIFVEGLLSAHMFLQYNSTASTVSIDELTGVNITDYNTMEELASDGHWNFMYGESGLGVGYWYLDLTEVNASIGVVRFEGYYEPGVDDRKYFNFTSSGMNASGFIPVELGISQDIKVPDNWWNNFESWNPTYYDSTTHRGWRDIYYNGTADGTGILNLLRFFYDGSNIAPVNMLTLASPWIRDGSVITLFAWLPLLYANNTMPWFQIDSSKANQTIMFLAPFKVSGASYVRLGSTDYPLCWRADILLPDGLSDYNITQFSYTVYFDRTTGILIRGKADIEMKVPIEVSGQIYYVPFGYHKYWGLNNVGGIPYIQIEWEKWANEYHWRNIGAGERKTLDSSFFNGGSATIECNISVNSLSMYTYAPAPNYMNSTFMSVNGSPIIKLMSTTVNMDIPTPSYQFNLTVNFYYTPSELSVVDAKESGFTICYYNSSSGTWVPLPTTWDSNGRIVSANITVESSESFSGVFALVAAPLTIWDILGPGGVLLFLYLLNQWSSPPMGRLLIPIGVLAVIIAVIAVALMYRRRKH